MSMVLQRMAVLQAVPSMAEADAADPEAAELARLAAQMPADETQLLYSLCLHGRQELGLAPDEYAALTMVLLRLLAFKPQAAAASAEKKTLINAPRTQPKPQPVSPPAAQAMPAAVPAPVVVKPAVAAPVAPQGQALPVRDMPPSSSAAPWEDESHAESPDHAYDHDSDAAMVAVPVREQVETSVSLDRQASTTEVPQIEATPEGDFWHGLVQQMAAAESINALVRELALQSQLVARDTDTWMLRIERESLNSTMSRERLQAALAAAGHAVRLTVEVGRVQDSPAKRNMAAAAARQAGAEAIILNDPYVQSLMRLRRENRAWQHQACVIFQIFIKGKSCSTKDNSPV